MPLRGNSCMELSYIRRQADYTGAGRRPPRQRSDTISLPWAGRPSNSPVGVSRSRTEPWQPRAHRPGGCLNPHARKGVSTFGNTATRRSCGTKAKKSPDFSGDFFIGFRLRYPQYPVCLHHQDRDKPLLLHVRHK